jgi:hypothetical protein
MTAMRSRRNRRAVGWYHPMSNGYRLVIATNWRGDHLLYPHRVVVRQYGTAFYVDARDA